MMINATYRDGCFIPDEPVELPEGQRVRLEPIPPARERIGIDESEWSDDPADIEAWIEWLNNIEPMEYTDEERIAFREFDEKMKQFNLEAVRRQMEEGFE